MRQEFLELGKIVGTHGVRGELKLDPWTDSADTFRNLTTVYIDKKPVRLVRARPHKRQELLTLEGVGDIDTAETLRGKTVSAKRDDLSIAPGKYFVAEILGCTVKDADHPETVYGTVTDVSNTGANDIWSVKKNGRVTLMPIIPGILVNVDIDREEVLVRPIKGIFDEGIVIKGE